MNLRKSKLQQREEEQAAHQQEAARQQTRLEFGTPEEMLRHDAALTPVPPAVAERLQATIERENLQRPPSWWRRFLRS
jgi:hypothetical protein